MLCVFQGYLVIDNFFKEEELNACKDAINLLVDQLANKLYSAGKIKSVYRWFHDNSVQFACTDITLRYTEHTINAEVCSPYYTW